MNAGPHTDRALEFEANRPRLRRLAYKLLGVVDDADDIIQESYLKWHALSPGEIRSAEAWLTTSVTRLCIDKLRQRYREQKNYTGAWLPEPMYVSEPLSPDHRLNLTADLSIALLMLLERLNPEERAVYLLHDAFDYGYDEISSIVKRTKPACRQLLHRARKRIQENRPRFSSANAAQHRLVLKFLEALQTADHGLLMSALAEDAAITSDGGGKVRAALNVVCGRDRVVRLLLGVRKKYVGVVEDRLMNVNGEFGIVTYVNGEPRALFAFETSEIAILALYRVVNPEKLKSVPTPSARSGKDLRYS